MAPGAELHALAPPVVTRLARAPRQRPRRMANPERLLGLLRAEPSSPRRVPEAEPDFSGDRLHLSR